MQWYPIGAELPVFVGCCAGDRNCYTSVPLELCSCKWWRACFISAFALRYFSKLWLLTLIMLDLEASTWGHVSLKNRFMCPCLFSKWSICYWTYVFKAVLEPPLPLNKNGTWSSSTKPRCKLFWKYCLSTRWFFNRFMPCSFSSEIHNESGC